MRRAAYRGGPMLALCVVLLAGCSDPAQESPGVSAAVDTSSAASDPAIGLARDPDQPLALPEPATGTTRYRARMDIGEQELGVPIYPGAQRVGGGTWRMTDSLSEGAESLTSLRLRTTDDIEQVAAFYRARIQSDPQQSFELNGPRGKTISLTTDADGRASSNVVLRQDEQGTRIEISVMGAASVRPSAGRGG